MRRRCTTATASRTVATSGLAKRPGRHRAPPPPLQRLMAAQRRRWAAQHRGAGAAAAAAQASVLAAVAAPPAPLAARWARSAGWTSQRATEA